MKYLIDHRLIEIARKTEGASITRGTTSEGEKVIIIVAVGTVAGLVEKYAREGRLWIDIPEAQTEVPG